MGRLLEVVIIFIVSPCTRLVLLDDEVFWDILRNVDVMCMLISYRVPHSALHFTYMSKINMARSSFGHIIKLHMDMNSHEEAF